MPMQTREYTVGFKYEPNAMQETLKFTVPEAAYAFALKVETEGGIAVVVPGYKDESGATRAPLVFEQTASK